MREETPRMAYEQMMAVTAPLIGGTEALAALAARMKLDALGEAGDPDVRAALDKVVSALTVPGLFDGLDETEGRSTIGLVTSFLKQALDLIEDPGRSGGWVYTDPVVLQSQGQSSGAVPPLIASVAPTLDGLTDALAREEARILDIGSGVAALSISCCRIWPAASVVGVDPWEPAMKLAVQNVSEAGLEDRITLRPIAIEDITDTDSFDLAWMPAPFLPRSVLGSSVPVVARSLRPGGWLVLGRYAAPREAPRRPRRSADGAWRWHPAVGG
jgi:SAM-dependent methyltransferase